MLSYHTNPKTQKTYERLVKRSHGLGLDFDLISNLLDLQSQIEHAIDLCTDAEHQAIITTRKQLHRAKMILADIGIALQLDARD